MKLTINGDEELAGRLEALDKAGTRITRNALKVAVQPVIDEAKDRARQISPTIADAIIHTHRVYQKGTFHYLRIGPMKDDSGKTVKAKFNPITGRVKARWHNPAKTGHLVEQGTQKHNVRLFGRIRIEHPGAKAHPYLGPAIESKGGEAQDIFFAEAWQGIRRELAKRAKKAARIKKKADALLAKGAPE